MYNNITFSLNFKITWSSVKTNLKPFLLHVMFYFFFRAKLLTDPLTSLKPFPSYVNCRLCNYTLLFFSSPATPEMQRKMQMLYLGEWKCFANSIRMKTHGLAGWKQFFRVRLVSSSSLPDRSLHHRSICYTSVGRHALKCFNENSWMLNRRYRCSDGAGPPVWYEQSRTLINSEFCFFALICFRRIGMEIW